MDVCFYSFKWTPQEFLRFALASYGASTINGRKSDGLNQ
jgi:hypothetical protein